MEWDEKIKIRKEDGKCSPWKLLWFPFLWGAFVEGYRVIGLGMSIEWHRSYLGSSDELFLWT